MIGEDDKTAHDEKELHLVACPATSSLQGVVGQSLYLLISSLLCVFRVGVLYMYLYMCICIYIAIHIYLYKCIYIYFLHSMNRELFTSLRIWMLFVDFGS